MNHPFWGTTTSGNLKQRLSDAYLESSWRVDNGTVLGGDHTALEAV